MSVYGLPAGFDASRFVGRAVEQVGFSANTVTLVFDGAFSITIEGTFCHALPGEEDDDAVRATVPVQQSRLMQLCGHSVARCTASPDGTLRLEFTNGHVLACYDDLPQYEAYRLDLGGEEIVV